jgi:curved DNA-binding protein
VTRNHYETLGLDPSCSLTDIRNAYRRLAKRHHPDVNPGDADAVAKLQAVNAAHEVLADPARRRAYDEEHDIAASPGAAPRGRIQRNLAQDVRLRVDEFFRGATIDLRVNDPGNPDGEERYAFVMPPDTAPGSRFRVPRTGAMAGGFITVRVKVSPGARFKAKGSDLQCEVRISNQRAANGGSEMIPSAGGKMLRLQIPAGVARGELLRIRGEGLPKTNGGRGDLIVKITYRPEIRIGRR